MSRSTFHVSNGSNAHFSFRRGKSTFPVLEQENLLFQGQKLSEKSFSITFPRAKIDNKVIAVVAVVVVVAAVVVVSSISGRW